MSDPLAAALVLLTAAMVILAIVLSGTLIAAELWTVGRRRTAPGAGESSPATRPAAGTSTRSPSLSGASATRRVTRAR